MKKTVTIMGHTFEVRSWTYGMKQRSLRAATSWREVQGSLEPDVDPYVLNDHMLEQCIETWDLQDQEGNPLEVTIENIHNVEPPELIEQLLAEIQAINGISVEERKKS